MLVETNIEEFVGYYLYHHTIKVLVDEIKYGIVNPVLIP